MNPPAGSGFEPASRSNPASVPWRQRIRAVGAVPKREPMVARGSNLFGDSSSCPRFWHRVAMNTFQDRLRALFGIRSAAPAVMTKEASCSCPPKTTYRFEFPHEKTIKRVHILEGCTICGACSAACPEVFHLPEEKDCDGNWPSALVKPGSDAFFESKKEQVHMAADGCCVSVIKIEYTDGTQYANSDERSRTGHMTKAIPSE